MADFLTTHGTVACIEEIISKAQKKIVLISPYLKWSRLLFERLRDADQRGVPVSIVFGKKELAPDQRRLLGQLKHLDLYFCDNLHAKCYFNETQLIISSLNLHEFSERNNREMGVRVFATDEVYKDAVNEAQSIIQASVMDGGEGGPVVTEPRARSWERTAGEPQGYCIRCQRTIPRDPDKPFCLECFGVWANWENWDFEEQCCHVCGGDAVTSRRRPLCEDCYRRAM
jgi:phosphatidylserine/phosphatidylglycerophosphate/cardiolipin synthase-like enzyme